MGVAVNARTAFSLLFPPILDEFGWDRGTTAGAFSFGFIVSAIMSPSLGRLMDKRGPLVVNELGVVLIGSGLLLATLVQKPWQLYATLGMLVGGGSVCLGYTGQGLFLPNWFVRRRGLAMSLAFAGVGVGSIILLPWLQGMIVRAGWRTACLALGIVVLVLLLPLNLLVRRRPEDIGLEPDGDSFSRVGAVGRASANVVDPAWVAVDWTLGRAMRTGRFWWIAIGYFCALFVWYAVQVHQTKYLVEIGFSPALAAWALGGVSLAGIPGQIALGHRVRSHWTRVRLDRGQLGLCRDFRPVAAVAGYADAVPALRHDRRAGSTGLWHYLRDWSDTSRDLPGPSLRHDLWHIDVGLDWWRRRRTLVDRSAARCHRQLLDRFLDRDICQPALRNCDLACRAAQGAFGGGSRCTAIG